MKRGDRIVDLLGTVTPARRAVHATDKGCLRRHGKDYPEGIAKSKRVSTEKRDATRRVRRTHMITFQKRTVSRCRRQGGSTSVKNEPAGCTRLPCTSLKRASLIFLIAIFGIVSLETCFAQQPAPPIQLEISQFQYTSVNASWVGKSSGPGAAASHDLRWRKVGELEWEAGREFPVPTSSFVASGLIVSTQYEFILQSRNNQGDYSIPITAFGETLSDYRATNVRAVVIKEKELGIAWEPARSGNLLAQQVFISDDNGKSWKYNAVASQGPMLLPQIASHTVPLLYPMARYLLRVESVFLDFQGVSPSISSQVVTTLPASPAKVVGLRINNLMSTSATLSWEPLFGTLQMGALSVIYLIDFAEVKAPAATRDSYVVRHATSLDVSQLLRNVEYFFTVVGQNNEGLFSTPSEPGRFTTAGALAAQMNAPSVVQTTVGLMISWQPLVTNEATGGKLILSFVLYTKRQDEIGFDSGLNIGNVLSYHAVGLTPNFFYEFSLSAVNDIGTGPRGKASEMFMSPIPPLMHPPVVRVIDNGQLSVIDVSWTAPMLAINILNYRVFLRQIVPFTAMDNGTVVPASRTTYRFDNLPDGTRFEIRVAAETSSGLTNISAGVYAETYSDSVPTSIRAFMEVTGETTCSINVTWTKQRLQAMKFRVFATISSITGASTYLTGSAQDSYYVVPECARGATYVYYVQAVFAGGSGGMISLDSPSVDIPVSPPERMTAPALSLDPLSPSTGIVIQWVAPFIINPIPKSMITHYVLTVGHPQATILADSVKELTIPAPATTYTLSGLYKKTYYTFMIQAVNSLGRSLESPTSSITTDLTTPAPAVNLSVVPGSEGSQGDYLTLQWDVADWGESDKAGPGVPYPYPYCPTNQPANTHCEGRRYFLATPFRIGDDYREPTYIYGNNLKYQFTGLSGGVDYTFVVVAVNTGGLQSVKGTPLKYRTVSVVPRAIKSLNVFSPSDNDLKTHFRIGIEWTIPIDAETTGGMTLSGFTLRYARLSACQSCSDAAGACINQRANVPWVNLPNLGSVNRYEFQGLKGSTYVFSIAAINGIGQGVFWPTCSITDINCYGVPNGQIPYTCHSAAYTSPSPIENFGKWAETQPGAQPFGSEGFEIRWGGGTPEYFEYSDQTKNGGRNIEMVEVQRSKRSDLKWPLDFYCPTLPSVAEGEQPVCLYQTGCTPNPCVAACPICVTAQLSETQFNLKKVTDYLIGETISTAQTYVYRVRFSNVGINDCASQPPSDGSSPKCTWSAWSDLADIQIAKATKFHNLFTRVNSPTSVQILWFVPTAVLDGASTNAQYGDFVNIWYGPTVASVSISPFDKGNFTKGPARGTTYQSFEMTRLVPATTYYFTVVSYYSTNNAEIQPTRSDVTKAVRTSVGIPAQVSNCSATVPTSQADIMAGGLLVEWIQLSTVCAKGSGNFKKDGSADNCERGESIPLAYYKISYRRADGPSNAWTSLQVASSLNSYVVTGLEKEVKYFLTVSAVNSVHEGKPSPEAPGTPIATIPGSPPPPLSTGASVSSVRIAWKEPSDLGTKQVLETKFRLTIYPRRDGRPGNETITFTWEREYVVTGLLPNSIYLFSVAYQATPMLGFGFSSRTAFVYTTPLAPINLRLSDGKNVTESTTVKIRWDWAGVVQGNVTITGYRLSFYSSDGTSEGQTFCSGGSAPVDGIPGAVSECVLAGLYNGKVYTISIAASNDPRLETSFGPDSTAMILQTKASLPTVVNIAFTETSGYYTSIHWTAYDGGLPILGYSLRTSRESEDFDNGKPMADVVSAPGDGGIRSSFKVTGLGANLLYKFMVVATNTLGFRASEPSMQVKTKPAAVSIPSVITVSTTYAAVSWPVWYGKNRITDFSIQARMNIDAGNIGTWFTSGNVRGQKAEVPSLLANTGYDIRVAAVNDAGIGEYGESVHIKTQASPPDFVYATRIGPGDCDLGWHPQPGATPEYTVFPHRWMPASASWIEEASRRKTEGEINFFHVTGLVKGARYRFEVATSSILGIGARSSMSHEITTLSSLPEPGPKPTLSNPSVQGLVVSWPAVTTNDGNGGSPATAYVLYSFAHMYQGGGWQIAARLLPPVGSDGVVGSLPTTYVAAGLEPDVNYQFKIAVENENGRGPSGPESERMPTVPGTLEAPFQQAFLKTILLTWTPGENNSYTAYRIGFSQYANNPDGIAENEGALWSPWTYQIVPSSTTLMKYDSLNPDYPYRFKMAARNPSGWGADSPIVESRTTIVADPWSMNDNNQVAMLISTPTITTTTAQLTWLGPASTDPNRRGSAVGFRITACQSETLICDTGDKYFIYCQEDPPNEYTKSHECDRTKNQYVRQGLLKNTQYYFELSIVNSGGEGPRSKPSPQFRTKADYPVQMARPVATSLSRNSISVKWDRMVDWNQRGGLDLTSYVLFKQIAGFGYDAGEVVYEGMSYTYTDLPSNTKFYFAVIAENTWCTICRTDIIVPEGSCFFEECCSVHSCSPKSLNSIPVSTKPGKMTLPRLQSATIYDILVTWDVLPGTPNNIFSYKLRFRDIDRADKDDSGGWEERIFAGTDMGIGVKYYPLVNLDPNNRYEVILNADNGFGYGDPSDSAILMTKANRIQSVKVVAVRATEITLSWDAPPGRQNNVLGYNISYRLATHTEITMQRQSENLPLTYVLSQGSTTRFDVINLRSNSTYIFSVAAVNEGGIAESSVFTAPYKTMILDLLGSCYFYSVSEAGNGVLGSLILQQKAAGTATLQGKITGLDPSTTYLLQSWQYGKSTTLDNGIQKIVSTFTASSEGEHSLAAFETALVLRGELSAISSSLILRRSSDNVIMNQCEMGIAKPRSGAEENGALPSVQSRAYCTLVSLSGLKLSGGFIASPTDLGIRVRGRVCGMPKESLRFSIRLHEFGDIQTGNYDDVGRSVHDMGVMYIDNLESANFDLMDAIDLDFTQRPGTINMMGRSIILYNQTYPTAEDPVPARTALAACVVGAHEPSMDTTVFQVEALPPVCTPCTWLMGLQESMYTVAEQFKTDWISVWSLNRANNPDKDYAGTSVYYAHPYVMQAGESMSSVYHRFGTNSNHVALLNSKKTDFLPGEVMCIVPQWTKAIDVNGAYTCAVNSSGILM